MNNTYESSTPEGIAIIGMAGRFPGAHDIDIFWQNIRDGVESIKFFSDEELLSAGVDPQKLYHPRYVKAGAILEDISLFDPSFFNISPREALVMDPQHRLFLECAWQALEHAGYNVESYQGQIGIYSGAGESNYMFHIYTNPALLESVDTFQVGLGTGSDHINMRVSYKLNLKGPSINVQTTCSSSLVAVCMACQSLLNYQADMMLAGGATIYIPQKGGYLYEEGGILSPDGHCRTFDAKAQGTVSGSGLGIVVLKRLEDALADGDTIYAVVKGSAINNDGSHKIGYTAPGIDGQMAVIAEAQALAQVDPETITYIEAHGTGTPLGDPIEVAALENVFRSVTNKSGFCAIGSVKTNIGHLDKAAGIAGLIKTVLMLKHEMLPPSLHFEHPNPQIDFASSPFYVNTALSPWQVDGHPRRAGVSSFGMGGTNAHMILEEAPVVKPTISVCTRYILPFSARTTSALEVMIANFTDYLNRHPESSLTNIAYTLQIGRKAFDHRCAFLCDDRDDALAILKSRDTQRCFTSFEAVSERQVTFLFPGQGSQYLHMAADLYHEDAIFREHVDYCSDFLYSLLGVDLRKVLYPQPLQTQEATQQLQKTTFTQPALFVIEYALAKLWMAYGIRPQAMIGHSLGEYVAACLAGVFSLEDALRIVAIRGQLIQGCQSGSMVAISLPAQEVQALLGDQLDLAAINGSSHCVVAGPTEEINLFRQTCAERDLTCRLLSTSHAFHSAMLDPIVTTFINEIAQIDLHTPTIPYVSNVTGLWITAEEATSPTYWGQHLRQTVQFDTGLRTLLRHPGSVLLEVGPGHTLSALAKQQATLTQGSIIVLASLPDQRQPQPGLRTFLATLAQLWSAGVQVDWTPFHGHEHRQRLPLPTYPFERQSYWIEGSFVKFLQGRENQPMISPGAPDIETLLPSFARPLLQSAYVAPTNELECMICHLWEQILGIDQVGIHDDFFELGGDSLVAIRCMTQLRETCHLEVPLRSLFEAPTAARLAQTIELLRQVDFRSDIEEAVLDLETEAILDATIVPSTAPLKETSHPLHVFLTGATGFVGIFLLYELLQQTDAIIYCLVRAATYGEGKKRLYQKLASFDLWRKEFEPRIVPVPGDLARPLLGLSQEQFEALAEKIEVIYHSGALVNFIYPYNLLKSANVLGTQEILRLACYKRIKSLHYISSAAVFELDDYPGIEVLEEESVISYNNRYHNGYAESKWVAEKLVIACQERGLPVVIYRLGNIAGHSKTGVCNPSDLLYRFIVGCIQLGMAPDTNLVTDITPVDYMSRAIIHLSQKPKSLHKVFHIVNPCPVHWDEVLNSCRSLGYQLEAASYREWRNELATALKRSIDNPLYPLSSLFPEEKDIEVLFEQNSSQTRNIILGCNNTLTFLKGSFIHCPAFDTELLSATIVYLIKKDILPAPK